jgi:hypothetical protein
MDEAVVADLVQRLGNLEYKSLAVDARLDRIDAALVELKASSDAALKSSSETHQKMDAIERAPAETKAIHEGHEKRLRTLEGAVGSVAYASAYAEGEKEPEDPHKSKKKGK